MIRAEASIIIDRSPREVLEYVLDLDRYRLADAKITGVSEQPILGVQKREGRARYRGRLRGFPTPSQWQSIVLSPWERLELRTEPGQWTAHVATFTGGFVCEKLDDGTTRLTHYEQFDCRAPARWVLDRYLGRWMQDYLVGQEQRYRSSVGRILPGGTWLPRSRTGSVVATSLRSGTARVVCSRRACS